MWDDKWSDPTLVLLNTRRALELCVWVCVWSYMQTWVLLGCVLFECVYKRIWLVWLVLGCVWLCLCVSQERVLKSVFMVMRWCVCVCANSRWFAWGFWPSCPTEPFCFVLTPLFLMDNQGHNLNTILPVSHFAWILTEGGWGAGWKTSHHAKQCLKCCKEKRKGFIMYVLQNR